MPLVRFQVKNEYGLGDPELYRGAGRRDDPKAVLDGVAVAGLVGILRQLGDLAEFAADIFHDLHEQVMTTSARGRKLLTRVQHIEAAIPSLENAIQGQTGHIHFAYVAGSDWHANLKIDQSHLLSSELPRFMLDSYEECRDPPRFYLLDKFDSGGTGSCLKRYSDPSYFKRVWTNSEQEKAEKVTREKKHMKNKRKGSRLRNGEVLSSISMSRHHSRIHFASPSSDRQSFSTENTSISDMHLIPQLVSSSTSFGSKTRMTVLEQVVDSNPPVPGEAEHEKLSAFKSQINQTGSSASVLPDDSNEDCSVADSHNDKLSVSQSQIEHSDSHSYLIPDDTNADGADSDCHHDSHPTSVPRSSSVRWDEKTEIVKPSSPESCADILVDMVLDSEPVPETSEPLRMDLEIDELEGQGKEDILLHIPNALISVSSGNHFNEVTSETENYMDALNTLESETETDSEYQTKREVRPLSIDHQESEYGTRNLQRMTSVDSDSSDINTPVASPSSLNNVVAADSLNLASSASSGHAQSPHTTAFASESSEPIQSPLTTALSLNTSVGYGFANNVPCTMGVQSFGGFTSDLHPESRVPNLETVPVDETTGGSSKPSDTPVESSGKSSTKLWTNAGLFGLEPSKPPDFSVSNKSNENGTSSSKITVDSLPSHAETSRLQCGVSSAKTNSGVLDSGDMLRNSTYMKKMDESTNTLSSVDHSSSNNDQICSTRHNFVQPSNPSDCLQSFHKNGHGDISVNPNSQEYVKTLSSSHLERIQDRNFDSNHPYNGIHDQQKVPDSCNIEPQPGVSGQNVKSISSSFSDLAQRFLVTSVPKKSSITRADISAPSGVMNDDVRKLQEASTNNKTKEEINDGGSQISYGHIFKGKIDQGSFRKSVSSISCYSGNSSPPLEHMKISFHPMNGLETSKLKLEFPNGNLHESNEDYTFPSFQLLPPSVRPSQDCDSESDDDTFCRSCPYSSDDILSPHSYSNSEFWDHDERSVSKDNEIYDDSQRLSTSSASNSSFMGFEQRNHSNIDSVSEFGQTDAKDDPSLQFGPVVDLPGLHSVISSKNQHEDQCDSLSNDCAKSRLPSTNELPPPPPLPPVQWRVLRSSFPSGEEHNSITAESSEHFDKLQGQSFTATHQEEETAANHICNSEIMPLHIEKKTNVLLQHDQQELNGKREKVYVSNELELDAREELLQQIRNKHGQKKINMLSEPKTNYDKEMEEREEFLHQIRNKHDQKKINVYSEVKTNDNKEPEEREELLHQIRNKSFNLRRTVAAKPTLLPQPATNVNVTAILEKANAIRQAFVGSDEEGGDDDNWSDN